MKVKNGKPPKTLRTAQENKSSTLQLFNKKSSNEMREVQKQYYSIRGSSHDEEPHVISLTSSTDQ